MLDPNIPHIPSLHCTICVSGYLQDDTTLCTVRAHASWWPTLFAPLKWQSHQTPRFQTPWEIAFNKSKAYQDIYCLSYEKAALLDLGRAFKSFIRNEAFKYAGKEALKMTALQAFFGKLQRGVFFMLHRVLAQVTYYGTLQRPLHYQPLYWRPPMWLIIRGRLHLTDR